MTPDKKARKYFTAAIMGAVASIGLALAQIFAWPDFVRGLCAGVMLVSLVMLLRRKLRDEYTEQLWRAGTSAAFLAVVVLAFIGPVVAAFGSDIIHGFDDSGQPAAWLFGGDYVGIGAAIAFYAGFHLAWLRSAS